MSFLSALQQRLFELHGMSPSADQDAQITVLFSDIQWLMQLPSATISASAATTSVPVETPASTSIYSNVPSHTVLANPAPPLVLPRTESSLSFHSSTVAPMELALISGPEESTPALPISLSPIHSPVAPATLNLVYGIFSYFHI